MKRSTLVFAIAANLLAAAAPAALAQDGSWLVRVRATHLAPTDKSDPIVLQHRRGQPDQRRKPHHSRNRHQLLLQPQPGGRTGADRAAAA
ncbi:hypothetical protein LP420_25350 [Massilia sp. B-10]|nr:hypothetical protein LP420_25350 [Massilia sp. B-10]